MEKQKKRNAKKKQNTGIAVATWLVFALAIAVVFLAKRETIASNLQETDFFNKLFSSRKQAAEQEAGKAAAGNVTLSQIEITTPETMTELQPPAPAASGEPRGAAGGFENTQARPQSTPAAESSAPPPAATATASAELCFVVIATDGSVSRKTVTRDLPRSTAPLTAALNALLSGTTPAEQSAGCTTLIPRGTRLLGASVREGIAYLNFSEEFEINTVGVEGYTAQMMQIVYTATNFPTVSGVQFLIAGERKEYLGSEGLWIGSPLGRANFR